MNLLITLVLLALIAVVNGAGNTLRLTLVSAEVENVDEDVGVQVSKLPVRPWNQKGFDDWVFKKGATDPQVTIRVGDPNHAFSSFDEVTSDWRSNQLTPTYLETYTFNGLSTNAEIYWAIYDVNRNPLDGILSVGFKKLIAEGRANLSEFAGQSVPLQFADPRNGFKINVHLNWSSSIACPAGSQHPRGTLFFGRDTQRCVCTEQYHAMGLTGECDPYPDWVETCATGSRCKKNQKRCVDAEWEKFDEICGHAVQHTQPCEFYSCLGI